MNLNDFEAIGIVKYNLSLSEISSMKTGGIAKLAFFPQDKETLCSVISYLKKENIKYCIIGNASNVIFPDAGYDGAVVFTGNMKKFFELCDKELENFGIERRENCKYVYAEAGASFTAFSMSCGKKGLSGLEFAYGIPGTVGGAVFMNAGAYGGETSDVLRVSEYIDCDGNTKFLKNEENQFSYRQSFYSKNPCNVIVAGVFELVCGNTDDIVSKSQENMSKRREKQPLEYPNCGSAFKRPAGHFAGALIEGAGLKGFGIGGAYVSEKHAGFIINKGGATTNDVLALIKHIKNVVLEKYGVELESEIRFID